MAWNQDSRLFAPDHHEHTGRESKIPTVDSHSEVREKSLPSPPADTSLLDAPFNPLSTPRAKPKGFHDLAVSPRPGSFAVPRQIDFYHSPEQSSANSSVAVQQQAPSGIFEPNQSYYSNVLSTGVPIAGHDMPPHALQQVGDMSKEGYKCPNCSKTFARGQFHAPFFDHRVNQSL